MFQRSKFPDPQPSCYMSWSLSSVGGWGGATGGARRGGGVGAPVPIRHGGGAILHPVRHAQTWRTYQNAVCAGAGVIMAYVEAGARVPGGGGGGGSENVRARESAWLCRFERRLWRKRCAQEGSPARATRRIPPPPPMRPHTHGSAPELSHGSWTPAPARTTPSELRGGGAGGAGMSVRGGGVWARSRGVGVNPRAATAPPRPRALRILLRAEAASGRARARTMAPAGVPTLTRGERDEWPGRDG